MPNETQRSLSNRPGNATPREVRGTKGCVEGIFKYEGDRLKRWVGEKDAWVLGYWFWDWAEERHRV